MFTLLSWLSTVFALINDAKLAVLFLFECFCISDTDLIRVFDFFFFFLQRFAILFCRS